jgi:hypothetical protein
VLEFPPVSGEVDLPAKSIRPAAGPRRSQARRQRRPDHPFPASHRPLQLELFGGGGRPAQPFRPSLPSRQSGQTRQPVSTGRFFPRLAPAPSPVSGPRARGVAGAAGAHGKPSAHAELFRRLSRLTGGRLRSLSLTDNRRTILSVKPAPRGAPPAAGLRMPIHLRIHRSFALAPDPVLKAVAAFLASARGSAIARQALAAIREHFHRHRRPDLVAGGGGAAGSQRAPGHAGAREAGSGDLVHAAGATGRRLSLCPLGEVLDLREIVADLNQRYFASRLKVRVTWGKAAGEHAHPASNCRRTRTASLQLGSYSYEDRLIRIHRVLDRPGVPRYVVESVVYHELLHADLPPVTRNGRRYFHTPEFRRRERQFRHFEKADCWVRENLQLLLKARRRR